MRRQDAPIFKEGSEFMANLKSHRAASGMARLLAVAFPLFAATAFAQNMGMPSPNMQPGQNMPNGNPANAQASGMSPNNGDNMEADMMNRAFVTQIMREDMAQIEMGTIVKQKSADAEVTQYAKAVVADFSKFNVRIMPIATELGVNPPSKPTKKEQKAVDKLQSLTGVELDQAYIQAMVEESKKEIQEFQNEASSTQNPDIRSIVAQGGAILTQHLQVAQQMEQNRAQSGGQ